MLQQVFLIQNLTLLWQRFMTLVIPKVQVQKQYVTDLYIPECKSQHVVLHLTTSVLSIFFVLQWARSVRDVGTVPGVHRKTVVPVNAA